MSYSPGQTVFARWKDGKEYLAHVVSMSVRNPSKGRVDWIEGGGAGREWAVIVRAAEPNETRTILGHEFEKARKRGRDEAQPLALPAVSGDWEVEVIPEAQPQSVVRVVRDGGTVFLEIRGDSAARVQLSFDDGHRLLISLRTALRKISDDMAPLLSNLGHELTFEEIGALDTKEVIEVF
jgi:hypothetical protein